VLKKEWVSFYFMVLFSLAGMLSYAQISQINLIGSSSNFQTTLIEFNLGEYQLKPIQIKDGVSNVIHVKDAVPILMKGAPDLPEFSTSIIIPSGSSMQIEVIDAEYSEIQNVSIAPSLGNFYRNEPLSNRNREYAEIYLNSGFFPSVVAELNPAFNFKGLNGQSVSFQPFQYDPSSNILRVYSSIKIRITSINADDFQNHQRKFSKSEQELFKHHFLNYSTARSSEEFLPERLVILSASEFIPELNEFIAWKKRLGFEVELINNQWNNANAVKSRLQALYQSNPFQYILIVGDAEQVPTPIIYGGAGDPSYGFLLGGDAYPEAFVGRISVENILQLKTQLDKIITYEKGIGLNNLSNIAGIASQAGPGDDLEYDFEHLRNINNQLIASGYLNADELFDGSQGGSDTDGNPTINQVNSSINDGLGLLFYTGHGTNNSFTTSGYSIEDISALNNLNSWPFICSVACLNGDFVNGTCLAEAFLRAQFDNQPSGAIAAFMSSINQSWNPPMSAQDEMANIIAGNYPELINYSLGNICALSCFKMIQDYGEFGIEMAATWHLFGDPTLSLRTRQPLELSATFPTSIQINSTSIDVECNVDNALISIIQNGILIGGAAITDGFASVSIDRLNSLDSLEITISAFNYVPTFGQIQVLPSNEAFIAVSNSFFNDSLGNNNLQLDYSEQIYFEFELSNLGLIQSNSINAQVICSNDNIELLNFTCHFDSISALQNVYSIGCIEFSVSSSAENLSQVQFELLINDQNSQLFSILINTEILAPRLVVNSFQIDELSGNFNGKADPGETLLLEVFSSNEGHSTSPHGIAYLTCVDCPIYIDVETSSIDSIDINTSSVAVFQLSIPTEIPNGTSVNLNYELLSGNYTVQKSIVLKIGAQIEDAESSNFTSFPWNNSYTNPWLVDSTNSFAGNSSFKSATILGGNSSELSLQITTSENDSIRFNYKVSTELNWDALTFYVDGTELISWSGEIDWKYASFPISAGAHELKWVYGKDNVVSAGLDAAWIDDIEFPIGTEFLTNIGLIDLNQEFLIYPNPTNGTFRIRIPEDVELNELQLVDIHGKLLVDGLFQLNNVIELPKNIQSGIYLLKFNGRYYKLIYAQ